MRTSVFVQFVQLLSSVTTVHSYIPVRMNCCEKRESHGDEQVAKTLKGILITHSLTLKDTFHFMTLPKTLKGILITLITH